METLLTEIRYGVRSLLKHPGFTAIAVVTLALGIGANTTIFSTVDALLLHPFSFPNQDRLVVVFEQNRAVGLIRGSVSPGNFVEWREQNQGYEELVAIQQKSFDVSDGSTSGTDSGLPGDQRVFPGSRCEGCARPDASSGR